MKRSTLKRNKGLSSRSTLQATEMPRERRKPINPVSDRRRKRDSSYPASRTAIYERAEGMCEARCIPSCAGDGHQVHHLAGRGGPDPHRLDNLLLCCEPCHRAIHAHPGWAYEIGLLHKRGAA